MRLNRCGANLTDVFPVTPVVPTLILAQEIEEHIVPSSVVLEDIDSSSVLEEEFDGPAEVAEQISETAVVAIDAIPARDPQISQQLPPRPRPSLLSSAKGWLSRVPSLGFLSPTDITHLQAPPGAATVPASVMVPSVRSTPERSDGAKSKKRKLEEDTPQTAPLVHATPQKRPHDVIEILDDHDELLLTPESASMRRREEEQALWRENKGKGRATRVSPVKTRRRSRIIEATPPLDAASQSQKSLSKRVAKASSSASVSVKSEHASKAAQTPPRIAPHHDQPVSPATRSTLQTHLLAMLDEAASSSRIVEDLDFEGVLALMRNVDALRQAAQGNLQRRAEEARAAKRAML